MYPLLKESEEQRTGLLGQLQNDTMEPTAHIPEAFIIYLIYAWYIYW